MTGRQDAGLDRLFYRAILEDLISEDQLLRYIDRILDRSTLRDYLAPYYSHTRRLSIDRELMIRMLLIGDCFGVRSERRRRAEVHVNLACRWFCRLNLEDKVPDHSTFFKARHALDSR